MSNLVPSRAERNRLFDVLAQSHFIRNYLALCKAFSFPIDVDKPKLDMKELLQIFKRCGVSCKRTRGMKIIEFDPEIIEGWTWTALLVIKRYDMLEPMLEGTNESMGWISRNNILTLAIETGVLLDPPVHVVPPYPRPGFDGDMATMERMVPQLIALFRTMKDAIRQHWATTAPSDRETLWERRVRSNQA